MQRRIRAVINRYVADPRKQQELLVDFLLVHLDFRPAFFLEDKHSDASAKFEFINNPEFIRRVESLGFKVAIGPFYDNFGTVAVIINRKHANTVLRKLNRISGLATSDPRKHTLIGQVLGYNCAGDDYMNYTGTKLSLEFVFIRNGIETRHLGVWCPLDSGKKQIPKVIARLSGMFESPEFREFKIQLRYSFVRFG